jgi:tyrosinase
MAAAAALPTRPSRSEPALLVRRSIGGLIAEQSPLIESYRRGVDTMMKRPVTEKTSWWFQANIHDAPDEEMAKHRPLAAYWQQCPHKNYFFLSWHRTYLYFFERILRKASGDESFALPYWGYDDPTQSSMPTAFLPDADELAPLAQKAVPPLSRRNPLARARRLDFVERRMIGLGDVARDFTAALALGEFATDDKLEAQRVFGGARVSGLRVAAAAGGIESTPHNLVHMTIGLQGDMGSPTTAARDPIFWLHHANIDRMWVKWTDREHGRLAPLDDQIWMKTKFSFVDEDGRDRTMSGAEVLDTQFQLGYRYDDDPPRSASLDLSPPVIARSQPSASPPGASAPGAGARGGSPKGRIPALAISRSRPREPVVLARAPVLRLIERETRVALVAVPLQNQPASAQIAAGPRLRVVLRNLIATDRTPPYDVFVSAEGSAAETMPIRLGSLDLFGGAGHGSRHDPKAPPSVETVTFEATEALAGLARLPGFALSRLRVSILRRGFPGPAGAEFVPPDPNPPRIGSIELLQS